MPVISGSESRGKREKSPRQFWCYLFLDFDARLVLHTTDIYHHIYPWPVFWNPTVPSIYFSLPLDLASFSSNCTVAFFLLKMWSPPPFVNYHTPQFPSQLFDYISPLSIYGVFRCFCCVFVLLILFYNLPAPAASITAAVRQREVLNSPFEALSLPFPSVPPDTTGTHEYDTVLRWTEPICKLPRSPKTGSSWHVCQNENSTF